MMAPASPGPNIMLAAVEPSADAMGAALLRELKLIFPNARFVGCGGPQMAAEGFESLFDIDAFAVMGFTDVAKVLPAAWGRARELAAVCAQIPVDIAVFVDGWSFSRLAAKRIRQRAPKTKIVKFAAPQVWASRPQRVDFVKYHFDLVLALLPFEPPYFEKVGVPATFVGNPNFQAAARAQKSGVAFRERHSLGDGQVLAVLPGSRRTEVRRLLPVFAEAIVQTRVQLPDVHVVIAAAPAVAELIRTETATWGIKPIIVPASERYDAFDAADAALAASGTVTTELAVCKTPMVIAYRVDPLTAYWAKRVLVTDYVSILNVAAGEMVIPERLQADCMPGQLAADILRLLTDEVAREQQLSAFTRLLPKLIGEGDAAKQAARAIEPLWEAKG